MSIDWARTKKTEAVGLGKEANRIETGRVLGQAAVSGRAKTYVDVKGRLLKMGRGEAKARGLPWQTVTRWKKRVRDGEPLADGHGGRALARVKRTLGG